MSDYPMLISNKLHSFRNFVAQSYEISGKQVPFASSKFLRKLCEAKEALFICEIRQECLFLWKTVNKLL